MRGGWEKGEGESTDVFRVVRKDIVAQSGNADLKSPVGQRIAFAEIKEGFFSKKGYVSQAG